MDVSASISSESSQSSQSSSRSTKCKTLIVVFYNPSSGNCQGHHLHLYNIQDYTIKSRPHVRVQLYDIKDRFDVNSAMKNMKSFLVSNECSQVYVMSAGGDGTFVTTVRNLHMAGIDAFDKRIIFSCIPLGTGNDLSQSIGWKRRLSKSITHRQSLFNYELLKRIDAKVIKYDLWNVILKTDTTKEDAYVETRGTTVRVAHIDTLMSNYMSIGLQGEVGVSFEQRRHTTRFMNIMEYTKQSIHLFFKGSVLRMRHFFESLSSPNGIYHLSNPRYGRSVEMIIQNIPGIWGRQVKLWSQCPLSPSILTPRLHETDMANWTTSSPSDGIFEIFAVKSRLDYLVKQFPFFRKSLLRMGQFSELKLSFLDDTENVAQDAPQEVYCMIDGEFYNIRHPKELFIKRLGQIQMAVHPDMTF